MASTADDGATSANGDGGSSGMPGLTCVPPPEGGTPIAFEVVNNRSVAVRLEGPGCLPPLRLFRERAELGWALDCGFPVCPFDGQPDSCAVCDCGQDVRVLAPGESTTMEWAGYEYSLIDPMPPCNACGSCWTGAVAEAGSLEATTEFRESCSGAEPDWLCDDLPPIETASVQFDYPGDAVVLTID